MSFASEDAIIKFWRKKVDNWITMNYNIYVQFFVQSLLMTLVGCSAAPLNTARDLCRNLALIRPPLAHIFFLAMSTKTNAT